MGRVGYADSGLGPRVLDETESKGISGPVTVTRTKDPTESTDSLFDLNFYQVSPRMTMEESYVCDSTVICWDFIGFTEIPRILRES